MYMTCSIGASKPVSSMSQTIRKAIPVSGTSSSNFFLKLSTALASLEAFLASVITAFSFVPSDETTTADLQEPEPSDEFLVTVALPTSPPSPSTWPDRTGLASSSFRRAARARSMYVL